MPEPMSEWQCAILLSFLGIYALGRDHAVDRRGLRCTGADHLDLEAPCSCRVHLVSTRLRALRIKVKMSTGRVLWVFLLALLAGLQTAAAQGGSQMRAGDVVFVAQTGQQMAQQSGGQVIAPSMALRLALRYSPGSQGLDVTLMQGGRPVYAVKLKTGNRLHRVLVDARTGQILGE
jgi:uncharacterized membrane protein YkoI